MRRLLVLTASGTLVAFAALAPAAGCSAFDESPEVTTGTDATAEAATETGAPVDGSADAATRQALTAVYARGFGGAPDAGEAGAAVRPGGMVVDPSGGVALVGSYELGTVDLGGAILPMPLDSDGFLMKLDGTGAHLASKAFTDPKHQRGVLLTGAGETLAAGFALEGVMNFSTPDHFISSSGNAGNFNSGVVHFRSDLVSTAVTELLGGANVLVRHAASGPGASVFAFGDWNNGIAINGGSTRSREADKTGIFFTRSAPNDPLVLDAVYLCDNLASCFAGAIASNPTTGELLAGGRFNGHIAGVDGGAVDTANGDHDAYLMKLSTALALQWIVAIGGGGPQEVLAATAVPGTNDFIAAGSFDGVLARPDGSVVPSLGVDIFVLRIDAAGKVIWLKTFGGPGVDRVRAITADAAGNIFLTGQFRGPTIDFGGGKLANADVAGRGTNDVFVAWLDGAGDHVYSARFGDGAEDDSVAIGLDAAGSVFLTGSFEGSIDFGSGPLRARGKTDTFVAKLKR